jgi:hypothetical protein
MRRIENRDSASIMINGRLRRDTFDSVRRRTSIVRRTRSVMAIAPRRSVHLLESLAAGGHPGLHQSDAEECDYQSAVPDSHNPVSIDQTCILNTDV